MHYVSGVNQPGLSLTPGQIHFGGNSGYQAIGLAWQFGARRIVLLGYDMQRTGGRAHWFGDHPKNLSNASGLSGWSAKFALLASDLLRSNCKVVNCSRETALNCFTRADIRAVLDKEKP